MNFQRFCPNTTPLPIQGDPSGCLPLNIANVKANNASASPHIVNMMSNNASVSPHIANVTNNNASVSPCLASTGNN
ncbi:hypothetical protein H6F93_10115 [Leptolyngbya sp. FACHB-671]|uniref:hypothetical protein n=1 Tax=Leptolyngbya sp. FACHB-671 TaxID=2692812 RepID=UPI001682A2D5|nr:hypothetical protein [Leptolyngbya sp. FACHB-671]MBD2067872.1 hypothetical protein [Leptolyngbya sp. FACHB-671]